MINFSSKISLSEKKPKRITEKYQEFLLANG